MGGLTGIKSLLKSGIKKSWTDKASSIAEFNKAKSIAREQKLDKELPLIESYIKIYIEEDFDNAKSLLDKYLEIKNVGLLGYCFFLLGRIYDRKGDYDKAIDSYQKALNTLGFDALGNALNNMGNAYHEKGDYDKAINFYQKALDTPGYNRLGYAFNNMGVAYTTKGEYGQSHRFLSESA